MGKKRIIKKSGISSANLKSRALDRLPKRKLASGILYIHATYNNTKISLTDPKGDMVLWSSAGAMGFKGSRKSTPYAASKVAELLAEKAKKIGLKEVGVMVKGVGAGRESAIRSFMSKDLDLKFIKDITPIPHNGPRPKKPRRV
jgi:small subunit ribosomal protein S11